MVCFSEQNRQKPFSKKLKRLTANNYVFHIPKKRHLALNKENIHFYKTIEDYENNKLEISNNDVITINEQTTTSW